MYEHSAKARSASTTSRLGLGGAVRALEDMQVGEPLRASRERERHTTVCPASKTSRAATDRTASSIARPADGNHAHYGNKSPRSWRLSIGGSHWMEIISSKAHPPSHARYASDGLQWEHSTLGRDASRAVVITDQTQHLPSSAKPIATHIRGPATHTACQ